MCTGVFKLLSTFDHDYYSLVAPRCRNPTLYINQLEPLLYLGEGKPCSEQACLQIAKAAMLQTDTLAVAHSEDIPALI